MRKKFFLLAVGGFALALLAAPNSLFAAEYSLAELYKLALARSEVLKVAEENLVIAGIGKEKAVSYLLPRMTATAGVTHYSEKKLGATNNIIQPESSAAWGVRLDETVSLSGRELTALGISRQAVTKSRYDVTAIREDYLLRFVAAAYYNVLMARKVLAIADANLERLSKYREATEKRLRIGEVTKTALLRAEGELSGARSDRLQAQNALDLALAVLARNVGIKDAFSLREDEDAVAGEIPALEAFREKAFATRADLKSLEVQKQIVADQVKIAEGAFWPTLSLSAVYSGADQNPASTNLNRESIYGGAALNFPFFEGGLRKAELAEAKARERQAALFYEDLKKGIGIEVQSAYLDLLTQKGILQFLADQLSFARENYQAVTRQFDFGLSNSLDVLDANTLLVSAETKAVSALYNYRLASLRMRKAIGMLLHDES
ncbi:MAG: TolC family protein [Deltaproteobacteria bacterium]|nr:TolC family protein [Deltaproteobacteria bacterium]